MNHPSNQDIVRAMQDQATSPSGEDVLRSLMLLIAYFGRDNNMTVVIPKPGLEATLEKLSAGGEYYMTSFLSPEGDLSLTVNPVSQEPTSSNGGE
jgi:hypothetical protein